MRFVAFFSVSLHKRRPWVSIDVLGLGGTNANTRLAVEGSDLTLVSPGNVSLFRPEVFAPGLREDTSKKSKNYIGKVLDPPG